MEDTRYGGPSPTDSGQGQPAAPIEPTPAAEGVTPPTTAPAPLASFLRELVETVFLAILIFVAIQGVWRNFRVEGSSMQPTIHDGEYLIVNRLVYTTGFPVNLLRQSIGRSTAGSSLLDHFFHPPQRGDIIVFIPPTSPYRDFIKRVIGLPGDTVEIKQGRVYVNGRALSEPYILPGPPTNFGPVVVAKGDVFVLGDNRGGSTDSRSFGLLSESKIVGKAWLSYWPPSEWGFMRHYDLSVQLSN